MTGTSKVLLLLVVALVSGVVGDRVLLDWANPLNNISGFATAQESDYYFNGYTLLLSDSASYLNADVFRSKPLAGVTALCEGATGPVRVEKPLTPQEAQKREYEKKRERHHNSLNKKYFETDRRLEEERRWRLSQPGLIETRILAKKGTVPPSGVSSRAPGDCRVDFFGPGTPLSNGSLPFACASNPDLCVVSGQMTDNGLQFKLVPYQAGAVALGVRRQFDNLRENGAKTAFVLKGVTTSNYYGFALEIVSEGGISRARMFSNFNLYDTPLRKNDNLYVCFEQLGMDYYDTIKEAWVRFFRYGGQGIEEEVSMTVASLETTGTPPTLLYVPTFITNFQDVNNNFFVDRGDIISWQLRVVSQCGIGGESITVSIAEEFFAGQGLELLRVTASSGVVVASTTSILVTNMTAPMTNGQGLALVDFDTKVLFDSKAATPPVVVTKEVTVSYGGETFFGRSFLGNPLEECYLERGQDLLRRAGLENLLANCTLTLYRANKEGLEAEKRAAILLEQRDREQKALNLCEKKIADKTINKLLPGGLQPHRKMHHHSQMPSEQDTCNVNCIEPYKLENKRTTREERGGSPELIPYNGYVAGQNLTTAEYHGALLGCYEGNTQDSADAAELEAEVMRCEAGELAQTEQQALLRERILKNYLLNAQRDYDELKMELAQCELRLAQL